MAEDGMTYEEAQEAVDDGDMVTASELQEMYPDKTMNAIHYDMAKEEAEMEMNGKIQEKFEFNEPRMAAKQGRKTCHTGPKGVLTDFEEAKLKWRAIDVADKIKRENRMYMNLDNTNSTASKLTIVDLEKAKPSAKQIRQEKDQVSSDDDEEEEEDEAALMEYKLQKMRILEENRPRFGHITEVTAWTFDKEVECAPPNVWVVMHVYQDYLERCGRMNYALTQIAQSYPNIKFVQARSDRIGLDTYPEFGLPTLIVFKNGQQLQNHIAAHKLIGEAFSVKDVEAFLIQQKVVKPVIVIPEKSQCTEDVKPMHSSKSNKIRSAKDEDSDSDSELDID